MTYAAAGGGNAKPTPPPLPARNIPNCSNRSAQKEGISQSENIVQLFGTHFSQKFEKARTFGPIFQQIMATSGHHWPRCYILLEITSFKVV